jgi:hypothetical protein
MISLFMPAPWDQPAGASFDAVLENVYRCSHPIGIATTPKAPAGRIKNRVSADFSRLEFVRARALAKPAHKKNPRVIVAIADINTNDFGTKRGAGPYRTMGRSARAPGLRTKCKLLEHVGARTTRIFPLSGSDQRALD